MLENITRFFQYTLVAFLLISGSYSVAQAPLTATHETDDQDQVSVTFSAAGFSTTPGDYTLDGGAITVAAVIPTTATTATLVLTAPVPIGKSSFTLTDALTSTTINSTNNRAMSCDDFNWENVGTPTPACAPVDPQTVMVFRVVLGARNSSNYDINDYFVRARWGSPGNPFSDIAAYESTNAGVPSASTEYVAIDAGPDTYTYPDDDPTCFYDSRWQFAVAGVGICPVSNPGQFVTYASHNEDDEGGGVIAMDPTVAGSDLVCYNEEVNMTFSDITTLNCINDPDQPNTDDRWVRIVYGDHTRPDSERIPNVYVGGVQVTDDNGALINNGAFSNADDEYIPSVSTASALGTGDFIGVVQFTDPPNELPAGVLDLITTVTTPAGQANRDVLPTPDRFYVTIEYWNTCNPYTIGNASMNQRTAQAFIELIDVPTTPTGVDDEICEGDATGSIDFAIAGIVGTNTAINWYDDDPRTTGVDITGLNTDGTNSATFPVDDLPAFDNNTPGNYSVWATYVVGASNSCESDPVQSVVTVKEDLTASAITYDTGVDPVCAGTTGLTFSEPIPAAVEPFGDATEYQWAVPDGGLTIVGPSNGQSVTINVNAGAPDGNQRVRVRRRYSSAPTCNSPWQTYNLTVDAVSDGGTLSGGTSPICEGESTGNISVTGNTGGVVRWERQKDGGGFVDLGAGFVGLTTISQTLTVSGTYDYRLAVKNGVCSEDLSSNVISIVVNDKPSVADLSGTTDICQGNNATLNIAITDGTAPYTVNIDNGVGAVVWNNAGDDPVVSPATTTTYTITSMTDANGCTPTAITGSATISVTNPTDAVFAGDAAICNSGNTDLTVTITGGKSPYDITITDDQGSSPDLGTINNYVSGSNINTGALTATTIYTLTSVIDDDGCPVLGISDDEVTVVVGVAISSASLNVADVCDGEDFIFSVDITDGAPLYTVNYTVDGNPGTENNYVSGTDINLGALAVGVHPVIITQVTDACGSTSGALPMQNLEVFALPTANDQTPTVCSDAALGNTATVDLTANNAAIDGGGGFTITWYENNSPLSSMIATPASYVVTDAVSVFAEVDDASCTDVATVTYTVNPRPSDPTNPVDAVACSSDPTGATLSVDDPGAGFTVTWYTSYTSPAVNTPVVGGDGTVSGTRDRMFTPASNATATFFAAIETDATSCLSVGSVSVTNTQDLEPTASVAGGDFSTCSDTENLIATAADNGGYGLWSINDVAYYENFDAPTDDQDGAIGTIAVGTNTGVTAPQSLKWSVDVSGTETNPANADVPDLANVNDYAKVDGGQFRFRDVDGEVVWKSSVFDITTFTSVDISLELSSSGLDNGSDYVDVYYRINGGASTLFATNGHADGGSGDFSITAQQNGLSGNTLQILVIADNNGGDDNIFIDNVFAIESGTTPPVVANHYLETSQATNLQVGTNTFVWEVFSALGACSSSTDDIIITRHALPVANALTPEFCEDAAGSNNYDITAADLSAFDDMVTGIPGSVNRTVEYFETAARLVAVVTPYSVANNDQIFTRVTRTDVTPMCIEESDITITVNTLPTTVDQNDANNSAEVEFCEQTVGSADKDDVDLTTLDNDVADNQANRSVTWYLDPGGVVNSPADLGGTVPTPTDVDNVTDGELFYALVENTVTNCQDVAQVEFTINSRPLDNAIIEPGGSTPATVTVCRSNAVLFFQIDPTLNVGSTYTWTVPTAVGEFELVGGGTVNDFFVLLRSPNVILTPGLPITVVETSPDGCTGNTNTINIISDDSPAAPVITGDTDVCSNQQNVTYSIAAPVVGSTYTWNIGSLGSIVTGQGTDNIIVNIGTTTDNITVVETSAAGCSSPAAAPYAVTVHNRPTMTSPSTVEICSGEQVNDGTGGANLIFTDDIGTSTYAWEVISKTGSVGGATVGNMGAGNITQTLTNTSGATGSVTYEVTPTGPAPALCVGTIQVVTVTVDSEPVGLADAQNICSDVAINYDIQVANIDALGNNLPSEFTFTVVTSNGAVPAAGPRVVASTANITDTYTNSTGADVDITYTITPIETVSGNSCAGSTFDVVFTIKNEPLFTGNLDATVCSDAITGVILPATDDDGDAITSYDVSAIVGAGLTGTATTATATANVNLITSDVFNNVTNAAIDVDYTITPYIGPCAGTAFVITVTVDPEPVFTGNLDATVCSDEVTGVVLPAMDDDGDAITSYDVSAVVGAGLTGAATTATGTANVNLIAADAFNNVTNAAIDVDYTITPYIGTCAGTAFVITVTVDPEPVFTGNLDATVCSDEVAGVVLPSTDDDGDAITSYDVSAVVGAGLTGAATTATGTANVNLIATDAFNNVTNAAIDVDYTITPYIGTCAGTAFVITVTVDPEPVYTGNLDATVCSDEVTGVVLPSTDDDGDAITSFDVSAVVGAGLTGTATTATATANVNLIAADAFNNVTTAAIDVDYTVTPYIGTCVGTAFVITVTVDPGPLFTGNLDATVCSDEVTGVVLPAMDDDGDAITSYDVSAVVGAGLTGAATTATGTANVNLIATDAFNNVTNAAIDVDYTITPYIGTCAGTAFVITVTVDPEPVFTGNLDVTVCSDEVTGVVLPATDDDGDAITSYDVSAVVGAGLIGAATTATGTANVNLIATDAFNNVTNAAIDVDYTITPYIGTCAGTAFVITVTVDIEPLFTGNLDATVCSDEVTGVVLPATDDDGDAITSYDVSAVVGAGLTGTATTATGTANVNLIAADAFNNVTNAAIDVDYTITPYIGTCVGTAFVITVTVDPEPVFTGNLDVTVCSDEVTGVVLPATDDDGDAITGYDVSAVVGAGLTGTATTATGTANVNLIATDAFNNVTNSAIDVDYTVIPYIGTCAGTAFMITVTVDPEPVYTGNLDATVCSDEVTGITFPITDDDGNVITSYDVSAAVGAGLTGTATTATGTTNINLIASDAFNNLSNAAIDVDYTITPYIGTCAGTAFVITVTVDIEPLFTGNLDATVCSDEVTGVVLPATDDDGDAITSYDVSASVGVGLTGTASTATGTANVNLISGDVFNNVTNAAIDVDYTITPYIGTCVGSPFVITVTVSPEPVFTGNLDATVCSDEVTGVVLPATDDDGDAITSYDVSAAVGAGLTGVATTATGTTNINLIAADAFNNVTNAAIDVDYTITPYIGTCVGTSFVITVTVNPEPVYTGILDATVCSDDVTGVVFPITDDDGNVITSYDVSAAVGAGLTGVATTATGTTNINLIAADAFNNVTTGAVDVDYTITPYIGTCVGTAFVITVTVNPEPVFTGNLDATVCSDEVTGLVLPATDDDGDAITSYDVSAVVGAGLTGTATTATGTANVNLIVADAFNNVTNAAVDVDYTVTPYIGTCVGTAFVITVTVDPEPVFTGNLDVTVCSDNMTGVVLPGTDDDGDAITSYDVSAVVGAGLTGAATTATGTNNVNLIASDAFNNVTTGAIDVDYTITPYIGTCAGTDFVITVTVSPEPVFTGTLDATVCSDEVTGVVLPATDDDGDAITGYDVSAVVGAGLTGTATTATGTANINLIAADAFNNVTNAAVDVDYTITPYIGACAGTAFVITVTVDPEPVFTTNLDATVCSDDVIGVVLPAMDDSGDGITSYDVSASVGAGLTGTATTATGTANVNLIAADVFNNVTNAAIDVDYTITPYIGTCAGTDFVISVTVDPEPVQSGMTATECSDIAIGVVLPTTDDDGGAITSYDVSAVVHADLTGSASTATGTTNINLIANDVFTNPQNSSRDVTYTIIPYFGTCAGSTFDIVVTIDPEPVGFNDTRDQCSDVTLSYNLQNENINVGNSLLSQFTYVVSSSDAANVPPAANRVVASIDPITDGYVNDTGADVTITYTVTPFNFIDGCQGDDFTVDFVYHSKPKGLLDNDEEVCSDEAINYNIQTMNINAVGNGVPSEFTYTVNSSSGSVPAAPNRSIKSNAPITDTYTNNTTAAVTITYTIVPISTADNCSGVPFDVEFTVHPEPVGSAYSEDVCGGATLNFDLQTLITNGIASKFYYTVSSSNAGAVPPGPNRPIGGASTANITDTYNNLSGASVTITYDVTPIEDGVTGCEGNTFQVQFVIFPGPEGGYELEESCSNVALNYDIQVDNVDDIGNSIPGKYTYSVSSSDEANVPTPAGLDRVVASADPITDNFINTTAGDVRIAYDIIPESTTGGCIGTPFQVEFDIHPAPLGSDDLDEVVCSGEAASYNIQTLNIDFNNGLTSEFTYTVASSDAANVPALPDRVVFDPSPITIAVDDYINTTTNSVFITYTVTPRETGSGNNCVGEPFDVRFRIDPEPVGTVQNLSRCSDEAVGVNITTVASGITATTFDIVVTNPDGLTLTGGTNSQGSGKLLDEIIDDAWLNDANAVSTITYTITPISADACEGAPFDIVVTVNPEPTITPTSADLCSNVVSGITLSSANGVAIASYDLVGINIPGSLTTVQAATLGNYASGNFLQNDRYINPGSVSQVVTYSVVAISSDNCRSDVFDIPFTVQPAPNFVADLDNVVCSDAPTGVSLTIDAASIAATDYRIESMVAPGLVEDAGNQVKTTDAFPINVTVASVNILGADFFTNNTDDPIDVIYEVTPLNGVCEGPTKTITVTVEPAVTFLDPGPSEICSGQTANVVLNSTTNPTNGGIVFDYVMVAPMLSPASSSGTNLGQGHTITDVLVNNTNSVQTATYTVYRYAAESAANGLGCDNGGTSTDIVVSVDPIPKMDLIGTQSICSGDALSVQLTSPSVLTAPFVVDFELIAFDYAGGNVTSSSSLTVGDTYNAGDFLNDVLTNTTTTTQIVTYTFVPRNNRDLVNCTGSDVTITVVVNPTPTANFDAIADQCAQGVYVATVNFPVGQAPFNFDYDIIDDGSNTVLDTGSGVGGAQGVVVVNGTENALNITSDVRVEITNVVDFNGCVADVGSLPAQVIPITNPNATFSPDTGYDAVCNTPGLVQFDFVVDPNVTYTWNWGDGSAVEVIDGSVATSPISHQYTNPSFSDFTYTAFLFVESKLVANCQKFSQQSVVIYPDILPIIFSIKDEMCSGDEIEMLNASIGAEIHQWSYSVNGTTMADQVQTTETASFTFVNDDPSYSNPQEFIIHYRGSKDNGSGDVCSTSLSHPDPDPDTQWSVMVYKELNVDFDTDDGARLYSLQNGAVTVGFVNNSIPVSDSDFSYDWNYGNGNVSTDYDPEDQLYTVARDYDITHTVTNDVALNNGIQCASSETITITVDEDPIIPDFTVTPDEECVPATFTITNQTTGAANQFTWKVFSGGTIAFETVHVTSQDGTIDPEVQTFSFEVFQEGTYTISLIAENVQSGQNATEIKTDVITVRSAPVAAFQLRPSEVVYVPDEDLFAINFTEIDSDKEDLVEWDWDFGDGFGTSNVYEPTYRYSEVSEDEPTGKYYITLTASYNYGDLTCSNSKQDSIIAAFGGTVSTPNTFTPNPDGPSGGAYDPTTDQSNDVFLPQTTGVVPGGFNMQVFDRWGRLLFESNDQNIGWDGYYKGQLMPQGVYIYKLTLRLADGERTVDVGDITLLR